MLEALESKVKAQQRSRIESYNNPEIIGEAKVHKVQVSFHKDNTYCRLFIGGNRCLGKNTRISLPNGRWRYIQDIKAGDEILAVDPDTHATRVVKVSEIFANGWQPCITYLARERSGQLLKLRCTPNHHILTERGLQEATYISHNTAVVQPAKLLYKGEPNPLAYALGYCFGNRSERSHRVTFDVGAGASAIQSYYRTSPHSIIFEEISSGVIALKGPLAPRFNKLASDPASTYEWLFSKCDGQVVVDFMDGFIDRRLLIDKRSVNITPRSKQEVSLVQRGLRSIGIQTYENLPLVLEDGTKVRVLQISSLSDIDKLLNNLKLVVHRDIIEEVYNSRLKLSNDTVSRYSQPGLSWAGAGRYANLDMTETYDLKLEEGNNLYIANGLVVGNSGKTEAGAVETYWYASGTHPYKSIDVPNNGRIIVESLELFMQDIVPKFRRWAPNFDAWQEIKGHQGKIAGYLLPNGSRIDVYTFNQESAKLEGTSIRYCWVNEPPPRAHVIASIRGLVDQSGEIWFTLTPLSEPYLYNDFYLPAVTGERKDIKVYEASIHSNPWLKPEEINRYLNSLDPEERPAREFGKFIHLSGRVFKEFTVQDHVIDEADWPKSWPITIGIDPHLRKNHIAVFLGLNRKGWYVAVNEIAHPGDPESFAHAIVDLSTTAGYDVQAIVADSFIEQPDASRIEPRKVMDEVFAAAGLPRIQIANKKNTKKAFISEMRRMLRVRDWPQWNLKAPEFLVMRNCQGLIKDFMNYVYSPSYRPEITGLNEEPIKLWDDYLDAIKYAFLGDPAFDYKIRNPEPKIFETYGGKLNG